MKEWRYTPVDEIGMPLPLRPPEETINFNRPDLYDRNHAFHPSTSPRLTQDLAGAALRGSRIQFCNYQEHHLVYHENYEGPQLPKAERHKFGLVVMAAALYIPDKAIDCRGRLPKKIRLLSEDRERLWSSGEVRVANSTIVRRFLIDYTLKQDMSHVKDNAIDEFLSTADISRKRFLGNWLLSQAVDQATEPLSAAYQNGRRRGRISPHMPAGPRMIVQQQLGPSFHRHRVVTELQNKLAA